MATQGATDATAGPVPSVTLRRGRLKIVVTAGILLLALTTGLSTILLVNTFAGVDRSDPRVVIREFLQAALVDHNVPRAQSFMCDPARVSDAIKALTATDDPSVVITFGVTSLTQNGDQAVAVVQINYLIAKNISAMYKDPAIWTVHLVRTSGWLVCPAQNEYSLKPE